MLFYTIQSTVGLTRPDLDTQTESLPSHGTCYVGAQNVGIKCDVHLDTVLKQYF